NISTGHAVRGPLVLPVMFTLTIFISASLLFFVQPLFAKLVLPQIGGAPAVWTTAMLFFQVLLLCGYVYAHLLSKHVPLRWQLPVHLAFWVLALTFLPLSVATGWHYDPEGSTTLQTLMLFAVGVGVPFGMLSANAPLLQAWYAQSSGPSARDPYFLYGSSNFGSLLALLAFPLVAEPMLGAQAIGQAWAAVFVLFGLFLALSGWLALRNPAEPAVAAGPRTVATPVAARSIALWVFLAFVPSSLMLAITTKVSTDMGALPLIWVVPLSIYIFSFVITFSNRALPGERFLPVVTIGACAVMAVLMTSYARGLPTWGSALVFAPMLFLIAVAAHRTLYKLRPDSGHLTLFYICMSLGGAMGGLFNSIVAPNLFDSIHEGWMSVLAAALIVLIGQPRARVRPLGFGLLLAGVAVMAFSMLRDALNDAQVYPMVLLGAICGFALAAAALRSTPAAAVLALAAFIAIDVATVREDYLFKDRSFFGGHTVYDKDGLRVYANGTTIHGYQNVKNPDDRPVPLSYYHPNSPMAQVLTTSQRIETARVGIVGLGVGSLACYATPGQSWEFYEIDHMVDEVARTPALFSFMSDCAPGSQTHLGDARIVLAQQDYTFDIMVLDAYSSDSIPLHLVTTEAVAMYLERLAPDGQLVFHISNRYYDLSQPLARIGRDLGLEAVIRYDRAEDVTTAGAKASVVMVLSPSRMRAAHLLQDPRWSKVTPDDQKAWTDDRAHVLSALK
ncbi:MAG: fused MFS/spermidine synthase, partial [Roseobacter sp.]|nr:fused MFS/spermidine synthase [Roseobacter sp.]